MEINLLYLLSDWVLWVDPSPNALRGFKNCRIIGYDIDDTVLRKALVAGAIDETSNSIEDAVGDADLTMFCSSPSSILSNMKNAIPFFKKGSIITDICGVKQEIISFVSAMFPDHVDYIGLHPMAGKEEHVLC